MHPELAKALRWWQAVRPCVVDNVFMQEHCDGMLGEPFQQRSKLMPRLCRKAGVKPFGFHALRHKAAAITFTAGGLAVAQTLMGHSRATTTDIYVRCELSRNLRISVTKLENGARHFSAVGTVIA